MLRTDATHPTCDCAAHPERQPCAACAKREHEEWMENWRAEMIAEYGDLP